MLSFFKKQRLHSYVKFLKQVGDRLELMGKLRPKFGLVFFVYFTIVMLSFFVHS